MAMPSSPSRSASWRTLRGGRPVTATKVMPASRVWWIAALVRSEMVRSGRSNVPSRSLATTRIMGDRTSSCSGCWSGRRGGRTSGPLALGPLALGPLALGPWPWAPGLGPPTVAGGDPLATAGFAWDAVEFVRIYWVLLLAGYRRQAAYRLALVSGLATNAFFGLVRTTVFFALYRQRA